MHNVLLIFLEEGWKHCPLADCFIFYFCFSILFEWAGAASASLLEGFSFNFANQR